jgi:hypothetical protein
MEVRVRKFLPITAMAAALAGSLLVGAAPVSKTINGWVLDSACAFKQNLTKPISRDCALACAKNGSPLVILQDDGSIYWPIAEEMPASGQNDRLLPYAGKRVNVSGKVYTRGGSNALVIEKIDEAK